MSPGQQVETVQDSKAKRQERLKSRFRDRGGIFVPAEGNPLVELLLARGVNGESPIKRRSPRKSTAARHTTTPKSVRSAKLAIKTPRTASKRARKSIVVPDAEPADEDALPQSRVATTKKNKARSTSNSKPPKSRSRPHTEDVEISGNDGGDPAGPSRRAVQRTAAGPGRKVPQSPSSRGERAARRGARGRDYDDHSDVPLNQKQATTAPAMTTPPKSGKRTGTKDARPPPARKKRAAPKTKTDAKRTAVVADDADGGQETKRTSVSAIARTQTGGASAGTEATAGKEAPSNLRKPGTEEGRGLEELPRRGEDVPDVVLPPTKRVQVLQEKSAPRKRKERIKNGEGDDGAIRTTKNENENGPPTKKRRRADPQTITAVSRRRPGKENENGVEQSKPARKASKGAMNKPTEANRKTTSKGKQPPLRSVGTRARSRGLPPAVLRRIKVNAQTLEAPQDIDDDDPIDFLR